MAARADIIQRYTRTGSWRAAIGFGAAWAVAGGLVWYVGATLLNRFGPLEPYVDALALLVGVGAGWGALVGSGRVRGWRSQLPAVAITLVVLAVTQAFVIRLDFTRALTVLGFHGARFDLPIVTYWDYMTWGLFAWTRPDAADPGGLSNIPAVVYWAVALANAVAIPRKAD